MKRFYVFFLILLSCFSNQIFADKVSHILLSNILTESNKEIIEGKVKVQPEEIFIDQTGIFLNLGDRFVSIEKLAVEDNGIYCFFDEGDDEDNILWECSYCYTLNKMSRTRCKRCGTWR